MKPRVHAAKWLIRIARLIDSLSIMVMKPDDLLSYTRDSYSRPEIIDFWTRPRKIQEGLTPDEQCLLDRTSFRTGNALVLGLGGGREAMVLARMGFTVTGVDFIPEAVCRAQSAFRAEGLMLKGMIGEISSLKFPSDEFNLVWLSKAMYSAIPTKKNRLQLLRQIRRSLRPEGAVVCQYHVAAPLRYSARIEKIRRIFAALARGNIAYETGDFIRQNFEFLHTFPAESDLVAECRAGGFITVHRQLDHLEGWGGSILKKNSQVSTEMHHRSNLDIKKSATQKGQTKT